jgi:hypothetical protein
MLSKPLVPLRDSETTKERKPIQLVFPERNRLLQATPCQGFFANYTSIGVVDSSPADVWDLIGDTCSWLTSVSRVREVPNSRRTSGLFGEQSTYDVVQTTKVNLVGKDFHVDMLMNINSNNYRREMSFRSNRRNKLMAKMEGSFKVIPLHDTRQLRRALPHVSKESLDRLTASHRRFGAGNTGTNRSVVILEQAVQPSVLPPIFVRGVFQKHLGRSIDHVMRDLQRGAETRKKLVSSRGNQFFLARESSYRVLVPAFAAIGRFVSEISG